MKFIYKIIILISLIIVGCSSKKIKIDEELIEKWANSNFDLPVVNGQVIVYVMGASDSIGRTNIYQLHHNYLNNYDTERISFKTYLYNVLFQREKVIDSKIVYFECDPSIMHKSKQSFDLFENYYTTGSFNRRTIKWEFYSDHIKSNTILYIYFLNGYIVSIDDYLGNYIIIKK